MSIKKTEMDLERTEKSVLDGAAPLDVDTLGIHHIYQHELKEVMKIVEEANKKLATELARVINVLLKTETQLSEIPVCSVTISNNNTIEVECVVSLHLSDVGTGLTLEQRRKLQNSFYLNIVPLVASSLGLELASFHGDLVHILAIFKRGTNTSN